MDCLGALVYNRNMLRAIAILLLTACAGAALVCSSAPWQQASRSTRPPPLSGNTLGYAPVWSHKFLKNIAGAQIVDSDQFAVYLAVVFILAVVAGICAYIILGPPWWRRPAHPNRRQPRVAVPLLAPLELEQFYALE